jgi:hypothetical protein
MADFSRRRLAEDTEFVLPSKDVQHMTFSEKNNIKTIKLIFG